jgi:hypothetical protein
MASLFCFMLFSSCDNSDIVLAEVDDVRLYQSEAKLLMEHLGYNYSNKKEVKQFIDRWCEQEVFRIELAEQNPNQAKLVALRAAAFSGELSKHYLEEMEIAQQLDTTITQKELAYYYKQQKADFSLQDYLVRGLYLKIPKGLKIEKALQSHFLLKNDKDLSKVNSYAKLYAENFYFNDEQWIYFNDLTKDIPLQGYSKDNIVLNRTKTYFSDDEYTYFINILDYKLKDATPPLDFLEPQIREIILTKRGNELKTVNEIQRIQHIKGKHDIKINL